MSVQANVSPAVRRKVASRSLNNEPPCTDNASRGWIHEWYTGDIGVGYASVIRDYTWMEAATAGIGWTTQSILRTGTVRVSDIQLCWEPSDLATTSSSPFTRTTRQLVSSMSTGDSYTFRIDTEAATPTPTPVLTKGATAGVIVGTLAGLVLMLSALLALMRYLRARRDHHPDHPSNLTDFLAGGKLKRRSKQGPQEMEGKGRPAEADAGNVRAELEGEWRGNEIGEADQ